MLSIFNIIYSRTAVGLVGKIGSPKRISDGTLTHQQRETERQHCWPPPYSELKNPFTNSMPRKAAPLAGKALKTYAEDRGRQGRETGGGDECAYIRAI